MKQVRAENVRASAASAPRILVVEDESDLAMLLSYNLEAEGYVVDSAERADEAELLLAENPPDLVILDWTLPGVSGLEICRRLRARENTRMLPVIMVTARGEEAERVRGLSVGADDYVVKPFSVPELMARVHALLRRSRPERIAGRLSCGDIDLDRDTRSVRRGERIIFLVPPNSGCSNFSSRSRAACSLAPNCSTAFGGRPPRSTTARLTCMSVDCARSCQRDASAIRFGLCAASATRLMRPTARRRGDPACDATRSTLPGRGTITHPRTPHPS